MFHRYLICSVAVFLSSCVNRGATESLGEAVLPPVEMIEKMVVTRFDLKVEMQTAYEALHRQKIDIKEFTIKPEHYNLMLACFFKCRELNPKKDPMGNHIFMGNLDLYFKNKRKMSVYLMYTWKDKEGQFKIIEEDKPIRWYYSGNDHVFVSNIINLYLLSK